MKKMFLLLGVGVGYVLGSRAGRERYEQIKTQAQKIAGNPKVQEAAHKAQDTVTTQAAAAAGAAKDKVSDTGTSAADKLRREASIQPAP